MYSLAGLGRDRNRQFTEPQADKNVGRAVNWWRVGSADALGNPIDGWVREYNHAGGRVTREFAQKWVDFQCLADAHDPAHTIFATGKAWVDYAGGADVPHVAALDKLSSLMGEGLPGRCLRRAMAAWQQTICAVWLQATRAIIPGSCRHRHD